MEKSEVLIVVLLVVAIALSVASIVIMNNNAQSVTGRQIDTGSGKVNASLDSLVSFVLSPATVDFGNVTLGYNYTTGAGGAGTPASFGILNDGTVKSNMSINATDALFDSSTNGYFKFNSSCKEGSCAATTYAALASFVVLSEQDILKIFEIDESKDEAEVGIAIGVPTDEPAGLKSSIVIFKAIQAA
jgi:hypothetical protein